MGIKKINKFKFSKRRTTLICLKLKYMLPKNTYLLAA